MNEPLIVRLLPVA